MAINQSILRQEAVAYRQRMGTLQKTAMIQESFSTTTRKKAFLCHSHKDSELVEGLLEVFQRIGIDLYVDWKDNDMPDTPNEETARKIKDHITGSQVFLFLATANAKASRWCPWELGYADTGIKKIFIIPTTDGSNSYGNEYLQLYPKIDIGQANEISGSAVFHPGASNGSWLTRSDFN